MPEFGLTSKQEAFREEVRNFARARLKAGVADRLFDTAMSPYVLGELARAGLLGLGVAAEYGGRPADSMTIGIGVEEVSRVDFHAGILVGAWLVLDRAASDQIKRQWLPAIVAGKTYVGLGVTEANCGTDAAALHTRAVKDGDDYVIDGEKSFVTGGGQAQAILVLAKTDPEAGTRGITCFLVPTDTPGVTVTLYLEVGHKQMGRAVISFDRVRCPSTNVIGGEGKGFSEVMAIFNYNRARIGIACVAAAQVTVEETIALLRHRGQDTKNRSDVARLKLAEHATRLEAARLVCYLPMWRMDNGLPYSMQSAMAKWLAPKVAVDAVRDCTILRAEVYSEELPVAQLLVDLLGYKIAGATAEACKTAISREVFGRRMIPY